jgi:hypothetical protein
VLPFIACPGNVAAAVDAVDDLTGKKAIADPFAA